MLFVLVLASILVIQSRQPVPSAYGQTSCHVHDSLPQEQIPLETVDLDKAPKDRWTDITVKYNSQLLAFYDYMEGFLGKFTLNLLSKFCTFFYHAIPGEYMEEMQGISDASQIEVKKIVLMNIFYEFFTLCTDIIALDPSGRVHQGHNLDFGVFMGWNRKNKSWGLLGVLRPLATRIEFKKAGKVVGRSVNFVGYVGILTGVSMNGFSLTINERFQLDGGYMGIIYLLLRLNDGKFVGFLARNVLLNCESYSHAKTIITNTTLVAPVYYSLAGKDQGVVVARDRESVADLWELNPKGGDWYLLQTNYDRTTNPPFFDDRVTPGRACMDGMTRAHISTTNLYNVLRTIPVRNKATIYVVFLDPTTGDISAYLQHCPSPCALW